MTPTPEAMVKTVARKPMTWDDRANQFAELAEAAAAAGDHATMIVALQRAAECIQIHRNLNPTNRSGHER